MGSRKHGLWKGSSKKACTSKPEDGHGPVEPPAEFLCPISGLLMADPVIVSSGQTFERACVTACKSLGFEPTLNDGSIPDFSISITNVALKTSILNWVKASCSTPPQPLEVSDALNILKSSSMVPKENETGVSGELIERLGENPVSNLLQHSESELNRRQIQFNSSDQSLSGSFRKTPLILATRPRCWSPSPCSPSSEFELPESGTCEDDWFVAKLRSPHVRELQEGSFALRKITKSSVESRISLCTPRLLSALRPLITSKHSDIRVNSLASVVNLSLEKENKLKIVRATFLPCLINIVRGRCDEAQDHACGALFSLALEDANKTAIGVLGGLQPLLHIMMRSESERAKEDAALALYHLSLVQSNRSKMVKFGSVQQLLGMVRSGQMPGRALLILCNLGACSEGKAAMLDAGAVEFLVELLKKGKFDSESTQENCVAALYALSHDGGFRFRGLAKAARAMDVLKDVVERSSSERTKDKARRVV